MVAPLVHAQQPARLKPLQAQVQELDALDARLGRLWVVHSSFLPPVELQEPLDRPPVRPAWRVAHDTERPV